MGLVAGSYENVVGGVSEQSPQSRRSGQMSAVTNMISDPVRGLARRHGSVLQDEAKVSGVAFNALLSDTATSVAAPFYVGASAYDLIIRQGPGSSGTLAFCFNKTARTTVPVVLGSSAAVASLVAGGASAWANVGRYLYIAGNTLTPTAESSDNWGAAANKRKMVGWVRGGAYSRVFVATLTKVDGTTITAEYKTASSSYQGILDTSDLDATADDYQKLVNDRTNAYNSAVTAWIGTASESITPSNIATQLVAALVTAGVSSSDVSVSGGYIVMDSAAYTELTLEDSGDGSLVRAVGNVIQTVDGVSSRHFVGKVVKVQPNTDKSAYSAYLKAAPKDGVSNGFVEVVWEETAGFAWTPQTVFCMATVEAGTLYIAGSAAELTSISGVANVPSYVSTSVGDDGSAPLPDLFGKKITCMAVFQDRLIIVAGATVLMSRPGDYLNWFRQSVLSVQDNDPWQGYALGAEDDVIRYWELFDRNLYLFGNRFQYAISGKTAITAGGATVYIASKYEDACLAPPRSNGNYVFYCKQSGVAGGLTTSLHQVQPGAVTDVADSYPASQVLDTYLSGRPVEILPTSAPNLVLLRTGGSRQVLYTYGYIDDTSAGTRKWDSWGRWVWDARVGSICGLSRSGSDILVYMVKEGIDIGGNPACWFSCEKFVRDSALSGHPYLDSLRSYPAFASPPSAAALHPLTDLSDTWVAVQRGDSRQLLGTALSDPAGLFDYYPDKVAVSWAGYGYEASATPTNPYVRDKNGVAILGGRLTLGAVNIAIADTGGISVVVTAYGGTSEATRFTGRVLGNSANVVGGHPLATRAISARIGKEVRECSYTIKAVNWLPLTVTAIEWSGQFFYKTRRV